MRKPFRRLVMSALMAWTGLGAAAILADECPAERALYELETEEGRLDMKNRNLKETVCEKCISDSIEIIEKLIRK